MLLTAMGLSAASGVCPVKPLQVERLPNLNTPRSGHHIFVVNDELTVVGGHTSGFIPTATAEYFTDGEWHQLNTVYIHDQGLCLPMSDGRVMLAGGHEKDLGIGQIFSVEMYHPHSHRFEGYGCLDSKRCMSDAVELDSGRVIISGNWYEDDAIELYKGERLFSPLKKVAQQRVSPFVLRTAKDDAIIFGTIDNHGQRHDTIIVDRLKGEPFTVALFSVWRPRRLHLIRRSQDSFIGDVAAGQYSYLIAVEDSIGQMAIARSEGESFSLLPTATPIPMECGGLPIEYFSPIIADRQAQRGYVVGYDTAQHFYVLAIDYGQEPAPLTLYQTAPQDSVGNSMPVLMPNGDLAIVGGAAESNFAPFATALLLKTGRPLDAIATKETANGHLWLWIGGGITAWTVLLIFLFKRKKTIRHVANTELDAPQPLEEDLMTNLMQRLCLLMEQEQPYQRTDLKTNDIADALDTTPRNISDTIRVCRGITFAQFVNTYRVEHAKQLLASKPDLKLVLVAQESGFATEQSFFRTFKTLTGLTPRDWQLQQQ